MSRRVRSNKIRLVVNGASGRMGTRILELARDDSRFEIVAGTEIQGAPALGRFIPGTAAPIVGNIREVLYKCDVVIDFTSPGAVLKTSREVTKNKRALVIGTTGILPSGLKRIKAYARRSPIVLSPNMSVGVNVLFHLVREAARALASYDIEVLEVHHNLKKDAPSGTAMKLAEVAAYASHRSARDFNYGRKGFVGARKKKEIGILASRAGDIVGDHTVLLSGGSERLELVHRAHSRDAFAVGALDAAAWVVRRRPGFYSMFDVLGIK